MARRVYIPFCLIVVWACACSTGPSADVEEPIASSPISNPSNPIPSRSTSGRIEVTLPMRGQRVSGSLTIEGRAQVFENTVNFRLRKTMNQIIAEGSVQALAPDVGQFGPFKGTLEWPDQPGGIPVELEVFSVRPMDGAPDHVVTIPLILE